MSTTINGVTARLGRDPEDVRRFRLTIQVYSKKRPGLKASNDIDPGKSSNQQHLLQLVGTAGAACAEYLGKRYGDNIDPAECAKFAIRAFGEECRLMEALKKDAPAKLKRLESMAARLRNEEQDLLSKLRFELNRGGQLTPLEVEWIDRRIGELHSSQL